MYRILTAVGFFFSLFGAFVVMGAFFTGARLAIPYGITFFGMGLVVLVSSEQQRQLNKLQDKIADLNLRDQELRNAVSAHGAALMDLKFLLTERLPEKVVVVEPPVVTGEPLIADSFSTEIASPPETAVAHIEPVAETTISSPLSVDRNSPV